MKMEQCSETSAYTIKTPGNYPEESYLPMKMEESSETSAYKIQTPGNYPEESYLPMKMEQCVPKRQHIQFRRRGITQKKATCL